MNMITVSMTTGRPPARNADEISGADRLRTRHLHRCVAGELAVQGTIRRHAEISILIGVVALTRKASQACRCLICST